MGWKSEVYYDTNGNKHTRTYRTVEDPNESPAFLAPDLDFRGTIVERIVNVLGGHIVQVKKKIPGTDRFNILWQDEKHEDSSQGLRV